MRFGDAQRQKERLAIKIALELIGRPFAGKVVLGLFDRRLAGPPARHFLFLALFLGFVLAFFLGFFA